jgi:Na+-driven multidrug efflux pump
MIPAMGLSMAISALVGQNIGAGSIDRAARIGRLGSWLGFGILTGLGAIGLVFATQIVAFFVPNDPGVIAGGARFVRIMALSWGFLGAQYSLTGVLRASGNMVVTMVLTLVSQWVLQFPLAYVLAEHTRMGAHGIWWAFPISNVVITLITMAVYARGDWKRKRLTEPDEELIRATTSEIVIEEGMRQV